MAHLVIEVLTEEVPFLEHKNQKTTAEAFFKKLGFEAVADSSPCVLRIEAANLPDTIETPPKHIKGPRENTDLKTIEAFVKRCETAVRNLNIENGFYTFTKPASSIKIKEFLEGGVIKNLFEAICKGFSKTMIWNETACKWIRPITAISITLESSVLAFEYAGVTSGLPKGLQLGEQERVNIIKAGIKKIEEKEGVTSISSEKLIMENANIAAQPLLAYAHFDAKYLSLPPKVLVLSLEKNQKYFLFNKKDGSLSNVFGVCINGVYPQDVVQNIMQGNQKVLSARLEDAVYYIKIDTKLKLHQHLLKLKKLVFHKAAGSVFERIERMNNIAEKFNILSPDLKTAINLCKADLHTEMVQSFTELQGYIGAYYARLEGVSEGICDAISNQYKIGIEDDLKADVLSYQLAFVEKYEKIESLLKAGEEPTSSRDPFGIRRDALALIKILSNSFMDFEINPSEALKALLLERLEFYLKLSDEFAAEMIIKELKTQDSFSLYKALQRLNFLKENKKEILEYKRVFNILNSKEALKFTLGDFKKERLDEFENQIFSTFNRNLSLAECIQNAKIIGEFFDKYLIIDEKNPEVTSNRIHILKQIYNQISRHISYF